MAKASSKAMRAKRRIAPTLVIFFTIVNSISGGGMVVKGITIYSEFGGCMVFYVLKLCSRWLNLASTYNNCMQIIPHVACIDFEVTTFFAFPISVK